MIINIIIIIIIIIMLIILIIILTVMIMEYFHADTRVSWGMVSATARCCSFCRCFVGLTPGRERHSP